MEEVKVLHRGYCVKSPPNPSHRWHKRWFTLTEEEVRDELVFVKKYYKYYKKHTHSAPSEKKTRLVLSYYKEMADEVRKKAISKFLIDDAEVSDHAKAVNVYQHAIQIKLSALYNERILLLCFTDKRCHEEWLTIFTNSFEGLERTHSIDLGEPVNDINPCKDNPLQKQLQEIREKIDEERNEKRRQSELYESSTDSEPQEEEEGYEVFDTLPDVQCDESTKF